MQRTTEFFLEKNKHVRLQIAEMTFTAGDGHIPSGFSIVEILSVLYSKVLKFDGTRPDWDGRDYFILSKGHGGGALYVFLERYGFITKKNLETKGTLHGILGGHPDSTLIPGVEVSTGSLGHGIAMALGFALGLRIQKKTNKVVTLIGDGESNEGTVWESALVAASLKLGNLLVIVDNNGSTTPILPIPDMAKKWSAFGWATQEIDGHNEDEVDQALKNVEFTFSGSPHVIIANTLKGKGVSFMEGQGAWHSRVPTKEEMDQIRKELS